MDLEFGVPKVKKVIKPLASRHCFPSFGFAVIEKVIYFMSLALPSLGKVNVSLKIFVFRSEAGQD